MNQASDFAVQFQVNRASDFRFSHAYNKRKVMIMNTEHSNTNTHKAGSGKKPPWTLKRAAALFAVILLVTMYLLAFVSALFRFPGSAALLRISLALTVVLPLFLWILIWAGIRRPAADQPGPDGRPALIPLDPDLGDRLPDP